MAEDEIFFSKHFSGSDDYVPVKKKLVFGDVLCDAKNDVLECSFDVSNARLEEIGQRHAFPCEINKLLIAGLEGRLSGSDFNTFDSLQKTRGEWLGIVFQNDYPLLVVYEFPKNVIWLSDEQKYDCSRIYSAVTRIFPIEDLPESGCIGLKLLFAVRSSLVKYVFSREANELPEVMQRNSCIWIPPKGAAWPMGSVGFSAYGLMGGQNFPFMASRGVSEQKIY